MPANNRSTTRAWDYKVGEEIHSWTIVGPLQVIQNKAGDDRPAYLCRCSCGKEKVIEGHSLWHESSKSCGHERNAKFAERNTTHGYGTTRIYQTWVHMKARCENPRNGNYKHYGALGIRVCDEWQDIAAFVAWAESSGYRDDLTIERKDVRLNYTPENCEWIPKSEQPRNRRNSLPPVAAFGETKLLGEWAQDERCRVSLSTLTFRIQRGWDAERAITEPARPIRRRKSA